MNFKELRQFIGFEQGQPQTQRDMGHLIGSKDTGMWGGWESGKHTPDTYSLQKVARTFNVTVTITPDGEISFDRE